MNKRRYVFFAAAITLFGMGGAGILICNFIHKISPAELFSNTGYGILSGIFAGLLYAVFASSVLLYLLRRKMLHPARNFFGRLLSDHKIKLPEIILLSFSAGVGEELLFRAAIQPLLGIWITAFLFIFLHGYLQPKNKPLFMYGLTLFIISAGFGYLMNIFGIAAAISAHFIIDVVLMRELLPETKKMA